MKPLLAALCAVPCLAVVSAPAWCAQSEVLRAETVIESQSSPGAAVPADSVRQLPNATDGAEQGALPPEGEIREGAAPPENRDEFADERKTTLTRQITEEVIQGIECVSLEVPAAGDGFDRISVDKATELGREILKICPNGSTCRINAVITNGTFTRIYSIQNVKN